MSRDKFEEAYAKMVVGKLPINDEVLYRFFKACRESMRDEAATIAEKHEEGPGGSEAIRNIEL